MLGFLLGCGACLLGFLLMQGQAPTGPVATYVQALQYWWGAHFSHRTELSRIGEVARMVSGVGYSAPTPPLAMTGPPAQLQLQDQAGSSWPIVPVAWAGRMAIQAFAR